MTQICAISKSLLIEFKQSFDLDERLELAEKIIKLSIEIAASDTFDKNTTPPEYEIWTGIKGYEGIYQISSYGRIKSLERVFIKKRKGGGFQAVLMPESVRSTRFTNFGYNKTSLWNNGKSEHLLIHRLVGEHFIFNPNPKVFNQISHLDNNPSNPKWDNLTWGTQKMNIQYAVKCGRWHTGYKNAKTKLKEVDIPVIRKLISDKYSSRLIGDKFGVGHSTILSIKNNKTWSHIK